MISNVGALGGVKNKEEVKSFFEHVGLYVGLIVYTAAGAKIFQILEHPLEEETLQVCKRRVITERESFVRFIFNDSWNSVLHRENIDRRLLDYEQTVARAANEGVNLVTKTVDYKWTYIQAVFFASTILTTIGYGNIAPKTMAGRVFCILFAMIGMPFTLSVISDVSQICATLLTTVWDKYKPVIIRIRQRYRRWKEARRKAEASGGGGGAGIDEADEKGEILNGEAGGGASAEDDEDDDDDDDDFSNNAVTAAAAVIFLTFYYGFGSWMLSFWEAWGFVDGFYFCFITMTTIGFGDIVPNITGQGKTVYMLVCMMYILVGLALTTTIIELVRRQYHESWKKMQELRAQIQAQLKLAATLRQMADQAGKNNIEFEGIDFAGDLENLKKNIAKFKKGKYGGGLSDFEINDLDWIDQNSRKVKAVTIFIYETSV